MSKSKIAMGTLSLAGVITIITVPVVYELQDQKEIKIQLDKKIEPVIESGNELKQKHSDPILDNFLRDLAKMERDFKASLDELEQMYK